MTGLRCACGKVVDISGERRTILAEDSYGIWCSNSIGSKENFILPVQLRWAPAPADDNLRLQAYLRALSGSQYSNKLHLCVSHASYSSKF